MWILQKTENIAWFQWKDSIHATYAAQLRETVYPQIINISKDVVIARKNPNSRNSRNIMAFCTPSFCLDCILL